MVEIIPIQPIIRNQANLSGTRRSRLRSLNRFVRKGNLRFSLIPRIDLLNQEQKIRSRRREI